MVINKENAGIINEINQINFDQHRKRRHCGKYSEDKLKIKFFDQTKRKKTHQNNFSKISKF